MKVIREALEAAMTAIKMADDMAKAFEQMSDMPAEIIDGDYVPGKDFHDYPPTENPTPDELFRDRMLGATGKTLPRKIVMRPDGSKFQAYPQQIGPDWGWIMNGCGDVTRKVWNRQELTRPAVTEPFDNLDPIRNYRGSLRHSLDTWPEEYRKAYEESH